MANGSGSSTLAVRMNCFSRPQLFQVEFRNLGTWIQLLNLLPVAVRFSETTDMASRNSRIMIQTRVCPAFASFQQPLKQMVSLLMLSENPHGRCELKHMLLLKRKRLTEQAVSSASSFLLPKC